MIDNSTCIGCLYTPSTKGLDRQDGVGAIVLSTTKGNARSLSIG